MNINVDHWDVCVVGGTAVAGGCLFLIHPALLGVLLGAGAIAVGICGARNRS